MPCRSREADNRAARVKPSGRMRIRPGKESIMGKKSEGQALEETLEKEREVAKAENGGKKLKEPTLEDVTPIHPNEYPAKHMKEKLDAHRERLADIEDRSHPSGLPDGPGN